MENLPFRPESQTHTYIKLVAGIEQWSPVSHSLGVKTGMVPRKERKRNRCKTIWHLNGVWLLFQVQLVTFERFFWSNWREWSDTRFFQAHCPGCRYTDLNFVFIVCFVSEPPHSTQPRKLHWEPFKESCEDFSTSLAFPLNLIHNSATLRYHYGCIHLLSSLSWAPRQTTLYFLFSPFLILRMRTRTRLMPDKCSMSE